MTSSWPSGAVVKVLACHAGGREFESPLEPFFFFFFFFEKRYFFFPLFTFKPLFCISLFLFFLSAQFRFFFQIDLHVISFSNLYKLNNLLISQLLILSMNYC